MTHRRRVFGLAILAAIGVLSLDAGAERLGYPPSEFIARRQALAKDLGTGTVVLFGRTERSRAFGSGRTTTSTTSRATRI